jgi:hypothetical protein
VDAHDLSASAAQRLPRHQHRHRRPPGTRPHPWSSPIAHLSPNSGRQSMREGPASDTTHVARARPMFANASDP